MKPIQVMFDEALLARLDASARGAPGGAVGGSAAGGGGVSATAGSGR